PQNYFFALVLFGRNHGNSGNSKNLYTKTGQQVSIGCKEKRRRQGCCNRVNETELNSGWCQSLYERKASGLVLYGRALGLSHSEAEDVLQETFVALLKLQEQPEEPEHYCLRSFRNRALNYHRGLWRRLARELESVRWFERRGDTSEAEADAMRCLADLPAEQREVIVL